MDTISASGLRHLLARQTGPCVSLYMTTHPAGAEGEQDTVRWKNLLHQIERQLLDSGMRSAKARELLKSAHVLSGESVFWKQRSHGLAVFISAHTFCHYRLPRPFDELALINHRFHIRPLLPLLTDGQQCFILALSQNDVRLFKASPFQIEQIKVDGLPANMKEALNYTSVDRGSQVHSGMRGSFGKQAAVFHGQGGQWDARKDDLILFFRDVDAAVYPMLSRAPAPLLLAGVQYLLPIYRDICSYADVPEEQLQGNCEYHTPIQVLERACPLIESVLTRRRQKAAKQCCDLLGTTRASDDITRILIAAHNGRVDTLFVDLSAERWGTFDPKQESTEVHKTRQVGDEDLHDLAAAETLLHGGTVYSVECEQIPCGRPVAALFRY